MPTYQYACTACTEQFEVVQKFTDDALTECPSCSGSLRKVFSAVGIVFKGSGFYRTDNRASANGSSSGGASANGSSGSSTGDSATPATSKPESTKSETSPKPEPAKPAATTSS